MSLAARSINSARWNVAGSALQVVLGVIRFILLSRLLSVEQFGMYAFGTAVVGITMLVVEMGMNEAFMHRDPATEDEERALRVLFTLRLVLTVLWVAGLLLWAWQFTSGADQLAVVVITLAHAVNHPLMHTSMALLGRRVAHRRLALRHLVSTLFGTVVSIWLAWRGAGLWALLATDIVNALATVLVLFVWRPVWTLRLGWAPHIARYYARFGGKTFLATLMLRTMDEIDDIWTRYNLGTTALGLYSRAFQFAIYPRQIVAAPLGAVADGTYSALKGSRPKLSEAFNRTNGLIIRSGFFLAGALALTAPEIVPTLLGEKFAPMIPAFQLMLVFALLDPLRSTIANLFVAVGKPERVIRARAVQLVALLAGILVLGPRFNIEGVALAVDIMLLVGIGILLWQARDEVDFSMTRLFAVPLFALIAALVAATLAGRWVSNTAWWLQGGLKVLLFSVVYVGVLMLRESRELLELGRLITARRHS